MQVELDTLLTLGLGNFLITAIDGLGAADVRTSSFLFSGRDGGLVTDQFYGFRQFNVTGTITSPTCEQHQIDREAFIAATPINTLIPVYITMFNGAKYLIYAKVIKPILDLKAGGKLSDYMLQLLAGDPLLYSIDGGDEQSASISRVTQGGYETPYDLPVDWASGSSPTIVDNGGDATFYPVITLSDAAINPSITNQTTGETFALEMTMVDGDELVIDMLNRTVKLNGVNVLGNKTADSTWWGLQPGNNAIVLDSDSGSDTVTAELVWRNGVLGV